MKLGLFTVAFKEWSLTEVADWAALHQFEALEVACWPAGHPRARATHVDAAELDERASRRILDMLDGHGLELSALSYHPNPLDPDLDERRAVHDHLRSVFRAAELLGVDTVSTFAGRDPAMPVDDSLELFAEVWEPLVRTARDHGVRVAFENCPMTAYGASQWPGGENVAATPYALRRIFELFPDDTLGLNLDPSHLVLQMIDCVRFIKEFGSRVYHMHAKDEAVDREALYLRGAWALGHGSHMGRVPGLGDVDWPSVMDALYDVGYDGTVSVELEDLRFETGDYAHVARGILIGRDVMRPYVK